MPFEPLRSGINVRRMHRKPSTMAGGEPADANMAETLTEIIPRQGSNQRAERSGGDYDGDVHATARRQIPDKRHDQFGGDGRKHVFQKHQGPDPERAELLHHRFYESFHLGPSSEPALASA